MIKGSGMIKWTMPSPSSNPISFQAQAYYVPKANQWLLSPQHFLQHQTNKHYAQFLILSHQNGVPC